MQKIGYRPKVRGDLPCQLDTLRYGGTQLRAEFLNLVAQKREVDDQTCKRLSRGVVQVTSNPPSFFILHLQQLSGEATRSSVCQFQSLRLLPHPDISLFQLRSSLFYAFLKSFTKFIQGPQASAIALSHHHDDHRSQRKCNQAHELRPVCDI